MHHHMQDTTPMHDSTMHTNSMGMQQGMEMPGMSHSFSLSLPMNRNGSGTGWLPDTSPMYGVMYHSKKMDVYAAWEYLPAV